MNKDQITNPLDAIRGRVPGLTILKGSNGPGSIGCCPLAWYHFIDYWQ